MAGMFGNRKNLLSPATVADLMRDPPIGGGGPITTPGIGDDLPGAAPMGGMTRTPMVLGGMAPAADSGISPWKAALGGFLDSISTQTGGQAMFAPQMMRRQDRQQTLEDWNAKQQVQLQNAIELARVKASMPDGDFAQTLIQSGLRPGTSEWTQAYQTRRTNLLDPVVSGSIGGKDFFGPRSIVMDNLLKGGGQASGGPAPGTVEDGYRFKGGDPSNSANWEPVAGGPTQPASAGFPRR